MEAQDREVRALRRFEQMRPSAGSFGHAIRDEGAWVLMAGPTRQRRERDQSLVVIWQFLSF
jgi:hypothetical protein